VTADGLKHATPAYYGNILRTILTLCVREARNI